MKPRRVLYHSKKHRQYFIQNKKNYPFLSIVSAIIEIQRVFRGYSSRKRHNENLRERIERRKLFKFSVIRKENESEKTLQNKSLIPSVNPTDLDPYDEFDVVLLQSIFRKKNDQLQLGYLISYEKYNIYYQGAKFIQEAYRRHRKKLKERIGEGKYIDGKGRIRFFNMRDDAAAMIQRVWKRYMNRQVFSFYKSLLKFKEIGSPSDVLKMINPRESKLLDRASGAHVRFRLGGTSFPPMIYYKIFVHNPIVDIGAHAPRDYTLAKQLTPHYHFNKITVEEVRELVKNEEGWYLRRENNNWRPINNDLITLIDENEEKEFFGPNSANFIKRRVEKAREKMKEKGKMFHYSKVMRKQDQIERRRRRKIEWMRKMYKLAKEGKIEMEDGNEKKIRRRRKKKKIRDKDVENLLNWSDALDFDEYMRDWDVAGLCTFSEEEKTAVLFDEFEEDEDNIDPLNIGDNNIPESFNDGMTMDGEEKGPIILEEKNEKEDENRKN